MSGYHFQVGVDPFHPLICKVPVQEAFQGIFRLIPAGCGDPFTVPGQGQRGEEHVQDHEDDHAIAEYSAGSQGQLLNQA